VLSSSRVQFRLLFDRLVLQLLPETSFFFKTSAETKGFVGRDPDYLTDISDTYCL
jgi:hypothetical protein